MLSRYVDELETFLDTQGDIANPVFIKDVRQVLENPLFLLVFLITLISALGLTGFVAIANPDRHAGAICITPIMVGITCLNGIFIPLRLKSLTYSDLIPGHFDLLSLTSLNPGKYVVGRWKAGMTISLFFLSILLPFVVFAYTLGGISILVVFVFLMLHTASVSLSLLVGIFLGGLWDNVTYQSVSTIIFVVTAVSLTGPISMFMFYSGAGSIGTAMDWVTGVLTGTLVVLLLNIPAFALAVATIGPRFCGHTAPDPGWDTSYLEDPSPIYDQDATDFNDAESELNHE